MWEDKQDKVDDGSPAIAPGGNSAVEHPLSSSAHTSIYSGTKLSFLARVFEPLLYPFAVIALYVLTKSTRKIPSQNLKEDYTDSKLASKA